LKVVGYNGGAIADEYILHTSGELSRIELTASKDQLMADGYDALVAMVRLFDENGNRMRNIDIPVYFHLEGDVNLLAVDNGWEKNVSDHYQDEVSTHKGRAIAIIQSGQSPGSASLVARIGELESSPLEIPVR
jgi:hypothetical protein